MKRRPDWLPELREYLRARKDIPYSIGTNDCCLFCAGAIYAMTGEDLAADYRETYHDEHTMQLVIDAHGGSLASLTTAFLKVEPTGPLTARRGDVVLTHYFGKEFIGICVGHDIACVTDQGIDYCPMKFATQAWRVG